MDLRSRKMYKVGQDVPGVIKFAMGWCSFIVLLILIFGPMILFSGLNSFGELNPVKTF